VLVDFKGGAAFDDLAELPHVAGLLTNLDDSREQGDVHRLIAALQAEIRRRQRAMRAAGVPDLTGYRSDQRFEPEPHLVVVVDEAAELLGSRPEVLDTFATIGRVGRSLGIHLVLAAQRPEEARLRSLEGALRFRICLRTLTTADSVAVVRDPGAATLPATPGWALLAVDEAPLRFRVTPVDALPAWSDATRARPVWHPPLPAVAPMPVPAMPDEPGALEVRLGLGDSPQTQWQGPVSLALEGSAGHLAVVGAPRTGRTSTLRTIAVDLAATVAPSRLHLYAVSADPDLHVLDALPHTGAVAHPADHDLVLDVVGTVAAMVSSRQHLSGDRVRSLHRPADVVLFIDDWPHLGAALPDLEPLVHEIAVAGLAVGIHLALSAHRWSELRAALRDCLGSRIELHLPDPLESLLPRTLPGPAPGRPGRGVLLCGQPTTAASEAPLPMHLQVSRLGPAAETEVRRRWATHPAPVPRIQSLPSHAIRPIGPPPDLTLGVGSAGPVAIDLNATDRHVLIVGEPGSGRSTVLGVIARALSDADCWLVDPRGSLRSAATAGDHVGRTPAEIETLLTDLQHKLMATLDGRCQARRTVLLVDDLDIAASLTSPGGWSAIAALLPLAADLKLSIAIARRCAGMARSAYDPFLAAIREAGATGVLLDGSPDEGPIVGGVRCRPGPTGRALLVRSGQPPRPLQLYAGLPAISQRASSF
jgi:S-DNA-T family DNA segregation ATPase FtsK/SpoIIIE